jgi:hypothetical protein
MIGTTALASSAVATGSGEQYPDLPEDKNAFEHKAVRKYRNPTVFLSVIEEKAGGFLQALYDEGYVDSSSLNPNELIPSTGLLGVSQDGEYGAWFRYNEPRLLIAVPSESHNVNVHVYLNSGETFAIVDKEWILKPENNDGNDGVSISGCDVCRSYITCSDIPCDHCYCNAGVEYGKKEGEERFCCCSACGCTDCGYVAEEGCYETCCDPCSS